MSAGLDFESKIVVKYDAPRLLKETLSSEKWKPKTLVMSGVTDPYQPIEKKLKITRRCIEVLAECLHPLAIITKKDRKSTRLNSSHVAISYAVFCLKKKTTHQHNRHR